MLEIFDLWFPYDFRGKEVISFTYIRLIWEAKFGNDPLWSAIYAYKYLHIFNAKNSLQFSMSKKCRDRINFFQTIRKKTYVPKAQKYFEVSRIVFATFSWHFSNQ